MEERDKQLLKMIRKQSEEGMSLLIDEYGGAIKAICSNVLRNYDAGIVQDAMQETVIRLWQKLSQRFQVKKNLSSGIGTEIEKVPFSSVSSAFPPEITSHFSIVFPGISNVI